MPIGWLVKKIKIKSSFIVRNSCYGFDVKLMLLVSLKFIHKIKTKKSKIRTRTDNMN
jgi:hypothetical protein